MKTVQIYKAQDLTKDRPTPSVEIRLTESVPGIEKMSEYPVFYDEQAQALFEALRGSLPGGTITRLTAKLLMHEASLQVIPSFEDKST